jgi:FMN reductase
MSYDLFNFRPLIIGIGGTANPRSTCECAVTAALKTAETLGAETHLFGGSFVSTLPMYAPGRQERTDPERQFIAMIRCCHGIIVGTPGYHGSISGPIKNVLDLIEDTSRDEIPYLHGRAFGCVVSAHGWQACGTALVSLRMIAHALRAWPTPFGALLNASSPLFHSDGGCLDSNVARQLSLVASQVVEFARYRAPAIIQDTFSMPSYSLV